MNKHIANKFYFSDFTLDNYIRLLKIAKKYYDFVFFHDVDKTKKSVVWRHDVEFSVPIAVEMALMENSLDLKSTYFFQIHGEFYNVLEKENFDSVKYIESLGHEIGLHFDAHFWGVKNERELEKFIDIDKSIFEKYFNLTIRSFSFHNTNEFILGCEKEEYAGLLNIYSKKNKLEFDYCTDSTGIWRFERLEDKLRANNKRLLQVLIHDGMWQKEVLPPRKRVFKVIDDQAASLKQYYDKTLSKFNVRNIDWDGEYKVDPYTK